MKKKKNRGRDPFAYSLQSNIFRQRIVENKKKKVKKYNWKKEMKNGDCVSTFYTDVFTQSPFFI